MDEPEQPTQAENKPPFIAGLPDAPLERSSDFPDYDGPLVCPFYGPDHPARRDEESTKAFNEDVARLAFGDVEIERLSELQGDMKYRGDWWMLARLHNAIEPNDSSHRTHPGRLNSYLWNVVQTAMNNSGIRTHLERAQLRRLHLDRAEFVGTHLQGANLAFAHLSHVEMTDVRLGRASLFSANLKHAGLGFANLDKADLSTAQLVHADLKRACLKHTKLYMAKLDLAVVRHATGILFDDNPDQRIDIEGKALDPWSVLRRTYTGPMFFVHLLLLVAFLLPYAAKALTLTTTARGYDALRASLEVDGDESPAAEFVRALVDRFDAAHTETPALWVLLGGTHDWWPLMVGTALCIIAYNALRGYLTVTIGVLRDQADRVQRTPTLVEYYGLCHPLAKEDAGVRRIPAVWWRLFKAWLYVKDRWKYMGRLNPLPIIGPWRLHQLARVLFWISIASVALHVGSWLWTTTVPVPK